MCRGTTHQESLSLRKVHFIQQETTFGECVGRATREQLSCLLDAMKKAERNGIRRNFFMTFPDFYNFSIFLSDHYWPVDTVPVYYGDIKVTLLNDSHYPDWVITEFMLQRVRKRGN